MRAARASYIRVRVVYSFEKLSSFELFVRSVNS